MILLFFSQPGDFLPDDIEVEKVIGKNKLRVVWPRRDGDEPDPPGADIPKVSKDRKEVEL